MNWRVEYLPEAHEDLRKLDGSQRLLVRKAIEKVSTNPLPANEGGYGKPLGNKGTAELSGFLKIKLRNAGLRVVYKVIRSDNGMLVVIIGARSDDDVYEQARWRIERNNL